MMSLDALGVRAGTDKSSVDHNYLVTYESLIRRDGMLVEIGVAPEAASMALWDAWLEPGVPVVGIDVYQVARTSLTDRVHLYQGNGGDRELVDRIVSTLGAPMTVIDDASHAMADQIDIFQAWWPRVVPGGVYIIEDLHAADDPSGDA